jgi:hypothetical protein
MYGMLLSDTESVMAETLWQFLNRRVQWPNRIIRWLKRIDSLLLAIATVALAWIAFWQWSALDKTDTTLRDTLVAANRAWIEASDMNTLGDIRDQHDLKIEQYYSNVGKSPATSLSSAFYAGTVALPDGWDDTLPIAVGPNHACDGLLPDHEGLAVFPDASTKQWSNSVIYRKLILPTVLVNKGALFLQGCYVYETMNTIHKTWFCHIAYVNGHFSTEGRTVKCKDGQGAN